MGMSTTRRRLCLASTLILVWLGCIPIEDLGVYWQKGSTDFTLAGYWKKEGAATRWEDEYISFQLDQPGGCFHVQRRSASAPTALGSLAHARTITFGKHSFIMYGELDKTLQTAQSQPADSGKRERTIKGGLQRYSLQGGMLTLYALNEDFLAEAIKAGRVKGHIPQADDPIPPSLAILDEKTVKFIEALADRPELWTSSRYERVGDFEQAIKQSREYPATQTTEDNRSVNVSVPDLAYFAEGKSDLLLRFLQASPEWRVWEERGQILAHQRIKQDGEWTATLNGYRSEHEPSWIQTRALFRFADAPGGAFANVYNRDMFTTALPDAGTVRLRLRSSDQGIESCLAIGSKALWFEFFEQTKEEPRRHTRAASTWLQSLLKSLRESEEELRKQGYVRKLLPADAILEGEPSLRIKDGIQGGIYDVYARINPGAPGKCYLKVFEAKSNSPLSVARLTPASIEYVGWSDKPGNLFLYNSNITVYEGDWDHSYEARFELWFRPQQAGPERKLIETTRTIVGWER